MKFPASQFEPVVGGVRAASFALALEPEKIDAQAGNIFGWGVIHHAQRVFHSLQQNFTDLLF